MIIVDTCVLSLAFRRKRRDLNPVELVRVYALEQLLKNGLVCMVGPIRQEILSGISNPGQFQLLQLQIQAIDDLTMDSQTHVLAAQFFNVCRAAAIAPGDIGMMICAAAHENSCEIFSTDPDFVRYAHVLPIHLYQP